MIVFFYCLNCLLSLYIFLFIYFSFYLSLPRSFFSKLLIVAYLSISHSLFLFLSLLPIQSFLRLVYCLLHCMSISLSLSLNHSIFHSLFLLLYFTVCLFHYFSHTITLSFTHSYLHILFQ